MVVVVMLKEVLFWVVVEVLSVFKVVLLVVLVVAVEAVVIWVMVMYICKGFKR